MELLLVLLPWSLLNIPFLFASLKQWHLTIYQLLAGDKKPQNSSYWDLITTAGLCFIKQMLVNFLLLCFFLEKTSNNLLEVSHTSSTLLIKFHRVLYLWNSFLSLYLLEGWREAALSETPDSQQSAFLDQPQGWGFMESFSWCNRPAARIRHIINIILLAYTH